MDTNKFKLLRSYLPDAYLIAESGINNLETLQNVIDLGYNGGLIGEHFLRRSDQQLNYAASQQRVGVGLRPARLESKFADYIERDAMLAIDAGAAALGFIFAESPRNFAPQFLRIIP